MTHDVQTFLSGLTVGLGVGVVIGSKIRGRLEKWRTK